HLRDWLVERCLRHLEHTEGLSALDDPAVVQRRLGARPEVRDFLKRAWPVVDPVRLVFRLLTEPPFLAEAADGVLSDEEQELLRWPKRPRSLKAAPWSVTDAFLVDEAVDVVGGTATFGHVVADEAQDLSAMQLRAIGRRCRFGSATLLGDLAQRTAPRCGARRGGRAGCGRRAGRGPRTGRSGWWWRMGPSRRWGPSWPGGGSSSGRWTGSTPTPGWRWCRRRGARGWG